MNLHRRSLRIVTLAVVVALPLLGTSGVASAKAKAKAGCHKTHTCKSGKGAGSGGGTGGASPGPITIQIDPNPLVETGGSDIAAVIQVETSPSFAGDAVNIDSSQLEATCHGVEFGSINGQVVLDDDGNATVLMFAEICAPGSDVVEADLEVAPFYTALGTLTALPPVVTPTGVTGYPTTSGTVTTGEVETGDTPASGDSDVYGVFYVEANPVYAEREVEISSAQLQSRCITGWNWSSFAGSNSFGTGNVFGGGSPLTASTTLDDDGNTVFLFEGSSCAAGSSQVIADVQAGTHPTYTTTFTILPPQPTI